MAEDAKIRGSPRKDQGLRGAAILHQQRRLKQATQFVHKDSADLLPLDGQYRDASLLKYSLEYVRTALKKGVFRGITVSLLDVGKKRCSGVSLSVHWIQEKVECWIDEKEECSGVSLSVHWIQEKEECSGQPYSVIQRRLLGGSPIKETSSLAKSLHLCNLEVQSTNDSTEVEARIEEDSDSVQDQPTAPNTSKETPGSWAQCSLVISCKVCTQEVSCKLSIERYENLISRPCVQRLGLQMLSDPQGRVTVDIEVGNEKLTSSAVIVDDGSAEFSIGLDTLVKLKSCIDLEHGVLKTPSQVIPFLTFFNNHPEAEKTSTTPASNQ
ncbi:PREDICTED: nuclear receptor-interacting protein 2 [Nanorana parkeri]|uniref:nuclear receptor-interacting protein 2 n=1 Tax=Nanorana parkeri TaxID=125878 RepID=UPI000854D544|nr:PREDICTED: nuclear receptor-interacting protein 2 [Nanorana parkeri]